MDHTNSLKDTFQNIKETVSPGLQKTGNVFGMIASFFKVIWSYLFRIRKIILAVPVVLETVKLAVYNAQHLPEKVGIDMLATGQYAQMISRDTAILIPVVVTGFCLAMMFCSRKAFYPWLISVFSLLLPVLLLLTNIFPV